MTFIADPGHTEVCKKYPQGAPEASTVALLTKEIPMHKAGSGCRGKRSKTRENIEKHLKLSIIIGYYVTYR